MAWLGGGLLVGLVLALGVVWIALGPFNQLSGKEMSLIDLSRGVILFGILYFSSNLSRYIASDLLKNSKAYF